MIQDIIALIKVNEDLARLSRGELTASEKAQAAKLAATVNIDKLIADIEAIA